MSYTKKIAKYDKITIDGTDVSNSFRTFAYSSEHADEDVSGFSTTGTDESLDGATTQAFTGEAFYTEELAAIVGPLHINKTNCVIAYQPDGLVDSTREIFTGTCTIKTFGPSNNRGSVMTMPFLAKPSTSAGITVADWT